MLLTEKQKSIFSFVILILSILWMKEVNYLYYNSIESPDFYEYFVYFQHFADPDLSINREHGLLYYYLHYVNYFFQYNNFANSDLFFHKSLQQTNFYIYIFGLFGYYKLLNYLKFKNSSIFLTFVFINFFPISIVQRIVFKPEILAFSLMPWIIYCIEKYKSEKNSKYILFCIPLLVSCLTLKGNVLVLVSVYLFCIYFHLLLNFNKKKLVSLFLLFICIFVATTIENSNATSKGLLDVQSGATDVNVGENYDNRAPFKIIYNTDLYNLVTSPIKHYHANSFIGITLLETTGDYFDLYWDNDSSNYFVSRKEFIEFSPTKEIKPPLVNNENKQLTIYLQEKTDIYLYESIGLIISLVFYYLLFKHMVIEKKYRKFLIAIIFGMGLLLFHSITGLPVNNFDPNVGDTFKPHYYSFLFLLSTIFLIINIIEKKIRSKLYLILYILLILLLMGIPKIQSEELNQSLSYFIEYSDYCEIENSIFHNLYEINEVKCFDKKDLDNLATNENKFYKNNFVIKPFNFLLGISSLFICLHLLFKDSKLKLK